MARKRYTEEQIISVLKEAQAGTPASELCRKHGVSEPTFYKWKAKYSGLEVSNLRQMKTLEEENRKLKQMVAEQALDNRALKELLSKNPRRLSTQRDRRPASESSRPVGRCLQGHAGHRGHQG